MLQNYFFIQYILFYINKNKYFSGRLFYLGQPLDNLNTNDN